MSAALKVHYNSPDVEGYDIRDATNSLATFMLRTKENVNADLQKRFNAIKVAPHVALWKNLPEHTVLPPSAIKPLSKPTGPYRSTQQRPTGPARTQPIQGNFQTSQNFCGRGRGTWHSPQGRGTSRENRATGEPIVAPTLKQRDNLFLHSNQEEKPFNKQ